MAANPGVYKEHLESAEQGANPDALGQIELDLHRTFPNHPRFNLRQALKTSPGGDVGGSGGGEEARPSETPLVQSLRRVLRAYACRNSLVGYCQGLNFIAGMMLLFLDEERVFWLLAVLLETILPPDYYAQDLIGCNVDLRVFRDLLEKKVPKVWKKLASLGVGVEFFGLEWFISLFSKTLPSETVLRIWDGVFSEGDKILFRAGLAILRLSEPHILAAPEQTDLLQVVQEVGQRTLDVDALLHEGFKVQLQRKWVLAARLRYRAEVEQERHRRAQRSLASSQQHQDR